MREFKQRISETPAHATVKGMYIDSFLQTLEQKRIPRPTSDRFVSFKDYPLQRYMTMLLEACPTLYPHCSIREGLKRQGRLVYPTLASSTVGKIMFAIAGRSWQAALPLASRAWEISLNPGSATLSEVTKNSAILSLRDVYHFADCFQVGIMEGAMETFLVTGTVTPRPMGRLCDVDLLLQWD